MVSKAVGIFLISAISRQYVPSKVEPPVATTAGMLFSIKANLVEKARYYWAGGHRRTQIAVSIGCGRSWGQVWMIWGRQFSKASRPVPMKTTLWETGCCLCVRSGERPRLRAAFPASAGEASFAVREATILLTSFRQREKPRVGT